MTEDRMTLLNLLNQAQDRNFLTEVAKFTLERLMDLEVTQVTGALLYERKEERQTYRNGYRKRPYETRLGILDLQVPKLREGSYYPGFLESHKRSEKALISVIQEAYVQGVSTRKMDNLVKSLGLTGISKSQVSLLVQEIDSRVKNFLERPIEGFWPYIWLDATYIKSRHNDHVTSKACVVAIGVNQDGQRHILGIALKDNESSVFWQDFLESLKERGLKGVRLVISDAHKGLKDAILKTLNAPWQRCWIHFMRNILAHVPKSHQEEIASLFRSVVREEDPQEMKKRWNALVDQLRQKYPKISDKMIEAEEDVLQHTQFPKAHRRKIYSNNPLERLNREIKRRSNVVGIFPNDAAVLRLVGELLHQIDENWLVSKSYMSKDSLSSLIPQEESSDSF